MNNNKKGSTLVMVILIMAILSVLGTALLGVSINENRFAIKEHDYQQAYYIARAGAEATAEYLNKHYLSPTELEAYLNGSTTTNPATSFGGGSFRVSLMNASNSDNLIVQSTGIYKGIERNVSVSLLERELFDTSIIVKDKLYINNGNNEIYGDIGHINPYTDSIIFGNNVDDDTINGDVFQVYGVFPEVIVPYKETPTPGAIWTGTINENNKATDPFYDKNLGTLDLGNSNFNIIMNNDGINDEEDAMELVFDALINQSNSLVTISGNGLLLIYINDLADFKGEFVLKDTAKVVLMVNGNGTVTLKTGSTLSNLYIYAPDANVAIKANYIVLGSIIANTVDLASGSEVHFKGDVGLFPSELGIYMQSFDINQWSD